MLQIAKALHMNAKIISFDEPTSSLSRKEVNALFAVISELNSRGITIIYVSHKLDEIYDLCNRATILRDGALVGSYDLGALPKEQLIRKMVGRDVAMFAKRHKPNSPATDEVVLSVDDLEGEAGFRDVSFSLKKGEILGFFGLVGAKRTEVMRAIFGADPLTHGVVKLHGNKIRNQDPYDAVANGIALIPENRKEQGFVKDLNNLDNISLASLKRYEKFIFQNDRMKRRNARHKGAQVGLTPNDPDFMTASLSGGNQQKVILAKWLSTSADVFIFDEPTKGIDVGSKAEIYALMEELLEHGKSIIMVSSELPEVIGISDRILVMNAGRIVAELQRIEFREDRILAYAVGEKTP
jgi:ABC-type sugar transport system ATPase subunit